MFVPEVHKVFFFNIWEMVEMIKTDAIRLLLVAKLKKSSVLAKYIRKIFFVQCQNKK